ncbi:hypothetical protein BGZ46_003084 [Entomortierella lignicola]|nr:hypothetical protein BGZ46_003084 [Entomortierella lignicola]
MNTRRLSFAGKITALNTYLLFKLWHVGLLYPLSPQFFLEVDKICKIAIWGSQRARIALPWFQRPKTKGGWGLINPRSQIQASKAKWLARWQTDNPTWKDTITTLVQKHPNKVLVRKVSVESGGPTLIQTMVKAYAFLDPKIISMRMGPIPNDVQIGPVAPGVRVLFGDNIKVSMFTVKQAKAYLDKKIFADHKAKTHTPRIHLQPPTYENLRLRQRVSDYLFRRLHAKQRRTNEKNSLYELVHHCINTNLIKSFYEGQEHSPACRRCCPKAIVANGEDENDEMVEEGVEEVEGFIPDDVEGEEEEVIVYLVPAGDEEEGQEMEAERGAELPPLGVVMESRSHAFHECPKVAEAWVRVRAWANELIPDVILPENYTQSVACWPAVKKLPPEMVKYWRKMVNSFKHRAMIELERIRYRDMLVAEKARAKIDVEDVDEVEEEEEEVEEPLEWHVQWVIAEWNYPPHIVMTRDRVEFGEVWKTV